MTQKPLFLYYWVPPVLWGMTVLCLSGDLGSGKNTLGILQWLLSGFVSLEPAQLKMINFYVRKAGHALAYGMMYFLWFRAFRGHRGLGPWRASLWSLGVCLFFSSLDEGRQWFYPSRSASLADVYLDMSGAGLAALVAGLVWTPGPKAVDLPGAAGRHAVGPE